MLLTCVSMEFFAVIGYCRVALYIRVTLLILADMLMDVVLMMVVDNAFRNFLMLMILRIPH